MQGRRIKSSEIALVRTRIMGIQRGLCPICDVNLVNSGKIPALDHDHDHGHIRGVLCANCNGLEGKVSNLAVRGKRSMTYLEWLKRLVAYLELHSTDRTGLIHPTHLTEDEQRLKRNAKARAARAKAKGAA